MQAFIWDWFTIRIQAYMALMVQLRDNNMECNQDTTKINKTVSEVKKYVCIKAT